MKLKEGISSKSGNKYSFWGCTMFPKCRYTENERNSVGKEEPIKESDQGEKMLTGLRSIYGVLLEIRDLLKK